MAFHHQPPNPSTGTAIPATRDQRRQEWLDNSISYYSKIMREERRKNKGQIDLEESSSEAYQKDYQRLAQEHWFAIRKVKEGQYQQAEIIYKRIIAGIMAEEEGEEEGSHCDHAKLAVTTLLLALHYQRMGDMKQTRSVFLNFFRVVVVKSRDGEHSECACSAKVLGAFALFEMKQGHAKKSLEIAREAVKFDPDLEAILNWKQFRDVEDRLKQSDRRPNSSP